MREIPFAGRPFEFAVETPGKGVVRAAQLFIVATLVDQLASPVQAGVAKRVEIAFFVARDNIAGKTIYTSAKQFPPINSN